MKRYYKDIHLHVFSASFFDIKVNIMILSMSDSSNMILIC